MISLPRFYAIADATFGDPVHLARALFEGGARLIQVRNKTAGAGELLAQVERILGFAPPGARVIVNDRADVARLAGATGVHLGQDDLPPAAAREILGPGGVVGFSTHNMTQALAASAMPIDYLAVGPIFQTSTKLNPDPVVGLELLGRICRATRRPVVAIGGITLEDAECVLAAGAHSIAVISDLLAAPDVAERAREWNARCERPLV
jgi:thiamine-phosphate pyrophosphorylase